MTTTMKKTIFILMAGLSLLLTSCKEDKFFELERPNQFPWQSAAELEMAARAPYLYYNKPLKQLSLFIVDTLYHS